MKVIHIGMIIERIYITSMKCIFCLARNDECDLRIYFQYNLQDDMYIATICVKANRIVGIIKYTLSCISVDMFILFKSLIRPIL